MATPRATQRQKATSGPSFDAEDGCAMTTRFPRYNVGNAGEPDRFLVMLAHDSAPMPAKTGPGSSIIGTLCAEKFGPFVAVFSRSHPGATYCLDYLEPARNWQCPWEDVHREANHIARLYNQPPTNNWGPYEAKRVESTGPQRKRTPAYKRRLKEIVEPDDDLDAKDYDDAQDGFLPAHAFGPEEQR